jgi:pimeloyl-ACP methyl ester carboxylesterase
MAHPQPLPLPEGIRSCFAQDVNGLTLHYLEAGRADSGQPARPCLLLLHGFPELAYSWRKVMLPLAAAGFHVIAPDQRGYGATTGWSDSYDAPLAPFHMLNLVQDATRLLAHLKISRVHAVVGHDYGSAVAGWCALTRPDIFQRVAFMSAPFTGAPTALNGTLKVMAALEHLPQPRQHYQPYYGTRAANDNMRHAPQGLQAFLRAYYHMKSADWPENHPQPLAAATAEELARLPNYYVMQRGLGMAETVAPHLPTESAIASCRWLPEAELSVYAHEYARTGFQGGLQWYRCGLDNNHAQELMAFAGQTVTVPAGYISGASDWGIYQSPGALEKMQQQTCTDFRLLRLIPGAGHWVQQEQPEAVTEALLSFLS